VNLHSIYLRPVGEAVATKEYHRPDLTMGRLFKAAGLSVLLSRIRTPELGGQGECHLSRHDPFRLSSSSGITALGREEDRDMAIR
jgi:hypothetical protein